MNPKPYRVPSQSDEWWDRPSEWLAHYMEADPDMGRSKTSDGELLRRIQELGYEGGSRANVLKWRRGEKQIPPEAFPKICLALGFDPEKTEQWTCDILREAYPDIAHFIRDPYKEQKAKFLQTLKLNDVLRELGRSRKKADLQRQLSEIEE